MHTYHDKDMHKLKNKQAQSTYVYIYNEYAHTYTYTYIHTCIHTYIRTCMYEYFSAFVGGVWLSLSLALSVYIYICTYPAGMSQTRDAAMLPRAVQVPLDFCLSFVQMLELRVLGLGG